jgi:hypothetical protein
MTSGTMPLWFSSDWAQPSFLQNVRRIARVHNTELVVTLYPAQADYVLVLDLAALPGSGYQTWTLVDATSGVIIAQDRTLQVDTALHQAIATIGRLWRASPK